MKCHFFKRNYIPRGGHLSNVIFKNIKQLAIKFYFLAIFAIAIIVQFIYNYITSFDRDKILTPFKTVPDDYKRGRLFKYQERFFFLRTLHKLIDVL